MTVVGGEDGSLDAGDLLPPSSQEIDKRIHSIIVLLNEFEL